MNSEVCSFSRPSRQRKFLGWAERGSLHRRSHRQGITDTRTHTEPGSNVMMGSVVPPMRTFTSIAQCLTWQKRWSLLAGCDIGKHRAVTVGNSRALFHDIQGACSFHRFVVQTRSQQLCSQQPADQRAPEKVREFTHTFALICSVAQILQVLADLLCQRHELRRILFFRRECASCMTQTHRT